MNTHAFEKAHQTKLSRQKSKIILFIAIIAAILFVAGYLLSEIVFVIKHVEINELSIYDKNDILNDIGQVEGSSLFFTSFADKKEELKSKYPYITDIKVKRILPGTVSFNVVEDSGSLSINVGSELFLLTKELRVISLLSESLESEKLLGGNVRRINLVTGKVSRCVTGEILEFSEAYITEAVADIYSALVDCGISDRISYIDLTNKFYIKLGYDDRFTIQMGDWKNAVDKVRMFCINISMVIQNIYQFIYIRSISLCVVITGKR